MGGTPWNNQQWVGFGYDRGPLPAATASHRWFTKPGPCDLNGGLPMHPAIIEPSTGLSQSRQASHSIRPCVCACRLVPDRGIEPHQLSIVAIDPPTQVVIHPPSVRGPWSLVIQFEPAPSLPGGTNVVRTYDADRR